MVYKYVSVFEVIEKLYRDYPHKKELDIWDVVEWSAEALDFIGAYSRLERIPNKVLTMANFKAKLPCELVTIDGVKYNEVPMVYASGVYGPENKSEDSGSSTTTNYLNRQEVNDTNFPMLGNRNRWAAIPYTYIVQDGYIHSNLESGEITISYTAVPVDSHGYPKIPDDVSYKSAVAAYVQMMLDRREWRSQRAPEAHYRDSQNEWRRFVRQARGNANMPSNDKMETMKRMWLRLKPNIKSHNSGFSSFVAPKARNNG